MFGGCLLLLMVSDSAMLSGKLGFVVLSKLPLLWKSISLSHVNDKRTPDNKKTKQIMLLSRVNIYVVILISITRNR